MPRVFIVHGWDGTPEEGWFPWLKAQLEARGFEVHVPQLPDAGEPRPGKWVPALAAAVGAADAQTYFVGHSMGCQTIVRYLETLPAGQQVGGAVFVAGFLKRLTGLQSEAEHDVAKSWLELPLNLGKVRLHLPQSVAIFSENDPFVPLDNIDLYRDKLGAEIVLLPKQGHFSGARDGATELPIVMEKVLELAK